MITFPIKKNNASCASVAIFCASGKYCVILSKNLILFQLLDVEMPGISGLVASKELKEAVSVVFRE